MVNPIKPVLKYLSCLFMVMLTNVAWASNATLDVDITSVEKDQTFTATFTYRGKLATEPDFSALEDDFDIVSQGLSQSVEIINGNYREQQSWTTVLLPKRTGDLLIPSIKFGAEQSNEQTITVTAAKPRSNEDLGDLFLEAELTPASGGYVQQQHMFTVRLYFRGWLLDGKLSDPELNGQDVLVQSLGEPRRYSVTRNGERYQVYERRHALFPQASGELTLGETTFSGRLRLPVGGNRLKSVSTPAITRTVLPVPTTFTGQVWLPAEEMSLTEFWPSEQLQFEQGVPITRTIDIRALGLSSSQLPVLELQGNDDIRLYPDQPQAGDQVGERGVTGTRSISVAMVPQRPGNIELPAIEVTWWDTASNRERVARLPGRTLTVTGVAPGTAPIAAAAETTVAAGSLFTNPWFYATLVCGLGWLLTWKYRARLPADAPVVDTGSGTLARQLKTACHRNDARVCARLLNEYRQQQGGDGAWPHRDTGRALKEQWQALNRALYGPPGESASWMGGRALWSAFEAANAAPSVERDKPLLAELAPGA